MQAMPELSIQSREAWASWLALYRAALRAEGLPDEERRAMQDAVNPAYIPRNHVLLKVIADVEDGNYSEVTLQVFLPTCPQAAAAKPKMPCVVTCPPAAAAKLKLPCVVTCSPAVAAQPKMPCVVVVTALALGGGRVGHYCAMWRGS